CRRTRWGPRRGADESDAEPGVPVDRLCAVHPTGRTGAGRPIRSLGRDHQDRMRVAHMTTVESSAAPSSALSAGTTPTSAGTTLWLTGLPSAGKTTLAFALAEKLRA